MNEFGEHLRSEGEAISCREKLCKDGSGSEMVRMLHDLRRDEKSCIQSVNH